MEITQFLAELSSSAPVPGGGGVSALLGSLSASLGSMVASLTDGKKKYAEYQEDITRILEETAQLRDSLYGYIQKDAQAFEPLAKAYGIPKETPGRDEILEKALCDAAQAPLDLMAEIAKLCPILEELSVKGSRLAISDVGVAATTARAAIEGAVMNVYINTGLMKNKDTAAKMNGAAEEILTAVQKSTTMVYEEVLSSLKR